MKQLYINGTGSGTCGVYLNSDTYLNSPSPDFNEYQIPAVNGNQITSNKRYNNVIRKFDCFINSNPESNLTKFKKLIYDSNGYMKIESDYDSDTYQYGYLAQEIDVSPFRDGTNLQIKFTLYFSCMPQKWFKTNSTATTQTLYTNSEIYGVYTRNDTTPAHNIKGVLEQLPLSIQPTDDYYEVFAFDETNDIGASASITNISASSSNDGLVLVYIRNTEQIGQAEYKLQSDLLCYGYGTASLSSYTTKATGTNRLYVLVPISTANVITGSAVTPNGTKTISFDTANYSASLTNSNGFGMDMEYEIEYYFGGGTNNVKSSPISAVTFFNNVRQNEQFFVLHFEQMDVSLLQMLVDEYADTTFWRIKVVIDNDYNAYAIKNTDTLNLTSYLEVQGDISGKCDKIVATGHKALSNTGTVDKVAIKPRWWKL